MTQRYIISWAQNATPVHKPFLAALRAYAAHNKARLAVIAGRYKRLANVYAREKGDDGEWWDPALDNLLGNQRTRLCKNLVVYCDVHVLPTAVTPTQGWEVDAGHNSVILGHPKRALQTVATATRTPRLVVTTGACTIPNYSDSRAGKRGEANHVLGALVIEVEEDGTYFLRHVSGNADGSFTDLDKVYSAKGVTTAPPALAVAMGDLHSGRQDPGVMSATKALVERIKPKILVLSDVLDFYSRNHHDTKSIRVQAVKRRRWACLVENEVAHAVRLLREIERWGLFGIKVVRSNHDEAFDRWLESCDPRLDAENAGYYFAVWGRLWAAFQKTGEFPDAFAQEAKRLGASKRVHFLRLNESLKIKGVEYTFHGHLGANGSRGSSRGFSKLGCKTVTAHTHQPAIIDGNYTVGHSSEEDHGYNPLPGAWLHCHCAQYADGKRALIVIVKGKYCGGRQ